MNCQFPLLEYEKGKTYREWGHQHGEEYREAIKELAEIRLGLMLSRAPELKSSITPLAQGQFEVTREFSPDLASEMEGLAAGSNLSIKDIVILNNYTDFRDIELPEEGCSTVYIKDNQLELVGQTWDMHSSAMNYVNIISIPAIEEKNRPSMVVFSLVGCLGMMGYNHQRLHLGVNNINTKNAKVGLVWPALVRKCLEQNTFESLQSTLTQAPVTSGHNYQVAGPGIGEHWEIAPTVKQKVLNSEGQNQCFLFHTNHCLGNEVEAIEDKQYMSSTTHLRYDLLKKRQTDVSNLEKFCNLLKDHEGYPKSICSHFESGAQDPSMTCGGGAGDLDSGEIIFWRGCDKNTPMKKEYHFTIKGDRIVLK